MTRSRLGWLLVAAAVAITAFLLYRSGVDASDTPETVVRAPRQDQPNYRRLAAQPAGRSAPPQDVDIEPEEDTTTDTMICRVTGDLTLPERMRLRVIESSDESASFSWSHNGEQITFRGAPPDGQARIHMRGHPSIDLSWSQGVCDPIAAGPTATVIGMVHNAFLQDTRRSHVSGCGARGRIQDDGSFEMEIDTVPCELTARRRDGPLVAVSEPVFLEPTPGDIIEVELVLPEHRMAGVGFRWELAEGGVRVVEVHPDTPADDEGLVAGDVIMWVDGESTEDMIRGDVRRTIGGAPDTEVQLTVLRGDTEIRLSFLRESLDHAVPEPRRSGKRGKHPW